MDGSSPSPNYPSFRKLSFTLIVCPFITLSYPIQSYKYHDFPIHVLKSMGDDVGVENFVPFRPSILKK